MRQYSLTDNELEKWFFAKYWVKTILVWLKLNRVKLQTNLVDISSANNFYFLPALMIYGGPSLKIFIPSQIQYMVPIFFQPCGIGIMHSCDTIYIIFEIWHGIFWKYSQIKIEYSYWLMYTNISMEINRGDTLDIFIVSFYQTFFFKKYLIKNDEITISVSINVMFVCWAMTRVNWSLKITNDYL